MSRLTINSNIASLNAQRNFADATKKISESYTRLSSGLRINHAVDDAAGLSISESLKADTRIFNQGIRNLNDGASLLNIADGALNELVTIATRLQELATQSANGTLGNKQRLSLDQEAQSLAKEYSRIVKTTQFNGRNLFDGDFGSLGLAAGGGADSLIVGGLGGSIGDATFMARRSYASTGFVSDVKTLDINSDGNVDLVTTSLSSNSINIYYGNGDGTFVSRVTYIIVGNNPNFIDYSDFNGDGNIDIVSTQAGTANVDIFFGNGGNAGFKAPVTYAIGAIPESILVEDIDRDGIDDLIATNQSTSSVSILKGNADGTFNARVSYSVGVTPRAVTAADLDNDGILDLAIGNQGDETLTILKGNPDGSFSNFGSYSSLGQPNAITSQDFNDDGIIDIAIANFSYGMVSVYIGNGDGTFKTRGSYNTGSGTRSVTYGDFNGDGKLDLLSSEGATNVIGISLGNGNGSFKSTTSFATGATPSQAVTGDFNNDGVSDIAVAEYAGSAVSVLMGNSRDGIAALQPFSLKTKIASKDAINYLSGSITRLTQQRGKIGAFQSRLDTAINNLQSAALNSSDASSRITDADMAEESSRLTANQIVQQAAASVLAQANLQPRLVLRLLEGI